MENFLLGGREEDPELPEEESVEELLIDALRADDGVVEVVDQGSNTEGKHVHPLNIEKKLKDAGRRGTLLHEKDFPGCG